MNKVCALIVLLLGVAVNAGVLSRDEPVVNPEEEGGHFEGDIMGVELDARGAVRVPGGQWLRWTNKIVPYLVDTNNAYTQAHRDTMLLAMRTIEEKSRVGGRDCIKFVPRTSQANYIRIVNGSGCSSFVGMRAQPGAQDVSLHHRSGSTCITVGIVMHELFHALGAWHEQSRPDRNNYVRINSQNVNPPSLHNFNMYSVSEVDYLGQTYDYGSIMHYGPNSFSMNGQPTITPLQAGVTIGQRAALSPIDIRELQLMYNC